MIKLVQIAKGLFELSKVLVFSIIIVFVGIVCNFYNFISRSFLCTVLDIINLLVPVIIFVAFFLFIISLVKYITFKRSKEVNQQKQSEIKKILFYAGISICLIIIAWAAFNFIEDSFCFPKWVVPPIP